MLFFFALQFSLHYGMFIPTLRSQTTDEQKKLFLEPALKHHFIGCYAQTEVRGSSYFIYSYMIINPFVLSDWSRLERAGS